MEKVAEKPGKGGDGKLKEKGAQKSPIRQQFELLQQTVGNQKVSKMMQAGIIPKTLPEATWQEMNSSKASRKVIEENQINADREALLPKILKQVESQKDKMDALKKAKPGTPIYANVTVNLKYASIPGEKESLDVYNTTELASVDLSYQNINSQAAPKQESKGYSIAETFSFVIDANEKSDEEEEAKEEAKNKQKEKNAKNETNKAASEEAMGAGGEGEKEAGAEGKKSGGGRV